MEGYKTVDSLISEIRGSGGFFKDNPQLIDPVSIYRWVSLALRSFGQNIMQKKSKMVQVENYRGILDVDFGKLSLAVFCECDKAIIPANKKDRLLETNFYKSTLQTKYIIESSVGNDGCKENICPTEQTEIIEKFFLSEADCDISLHYKNLSYVKLGRDVLHGGCTDDCINRNVIDEKYSINIKNTTLYANFKEGNLYLEYYATPCDPDSGIPIIPDSDRGKVEQWLEALIKKKILFEAQLSKDVQNIQYLYNEVLLEERQLFREAQQDVSKMNLTAFWKLIDANRKRISRFDIHLK